ncbi:Vegetative incompatibility protein HET-E-1 [Escovopsis weberi]|uniref:Vegetative incompatibility protein HET-E-1 n=1 Tax=Escovopsis weberi TaxID=150374 RepID=A0A0N0RST3_ESCWE|nr:Vegetative incompatibility protein HET-E-1 [Escovopsis weberi]
MKPVVSATNAWSCTVISAFAIVILSVIAALYRKGHEEFVGSLDDPIDGKAISGTIVTAVFVYIGFLAFCGCQGMLHDIEALADEDDENHHDHGHKRTGRVLLKAGWQKVVESCEVALELKLEWIWIDTCCIDKTSSAELSEALNSMFEWYERAAVCIAFLHDVTATNPEYDYRHYGPRDWLKYFGHGLTRTETPIWHEDEGPGQESVSKEFDAQFSKSRWFTRGWTLQELIAPRELSFYSRHWRPLGTRASLKSIVHDVTSIPESVLGTRPGERKEVLKGICVAEKMGWAARRETARREDAACSLLGIFDINMPLIYGEGKVKAFRRLQEEIIRSTGDDSIYAWRYPDMPVPCMQNFWGLLAEGPDAFERHGDYWRRIPRFLSRSSSLATWTSARGLHVELALRPCLGDPSGSIFLGLLGCDMRGVQPLRNFTPAILLQKTSWFNETEFVRIRPDILVMLTMNRIVFPDELVDKENRHKVILEAVSRQIYIPHHQPLPWYPYGIVYPHDTGQKLPVSSSWRFGGSDRWVNQSDAYVLNFVTAPVSSMKDLKESIIIGSRSLVVKYS